MIFMKSMLVINSFLKSGYNMHFVIMLGLNPEHRLRPRLAQSRQRE